MTYPENIPPSAHHVELQTGEEISIKFAYSPEFNERQIIRPDGKIMLLLVGEVEAAGKTPENLRKELINLYTKYLSHPDLTIIIRSSSDQKVYVGGSVNKPGVLNHQGNMSALEAIMESGGFDFTTAKASNVIIIRFKEGKRYAYSLNLKRALNGQESRPFYLEPQDIVYVPRTTIAKVDQWVDQHFWKIFQTRFGFGFVYDLNNGNNY